MPVAIVVLLLDITLIYHASKTGRLQPWAFIILMVPFIGALAYIVVELVPEWFGSPGAQQARKRIAGKLDPEKRYRELCERLAGTETIANREMLAAECLRIGRFDEAARHYDHILNLPMGSEPAYALGKAQAEFGCNRPADAIATLDDLQKHWPDFQSAEGHLLYGRALAEVGRIDEALGEYHAVATYFPGAEALVRYGMLLHLVGRTAEGRVVLNELLIQMRRALPAAGTGPFRITKVVPRQEANLARFDGYWDPGKKPKVDNVVLMPIPEANSRLAALRSGQVDWIEVPPPDGLASLKSAGFTVTTGSYPHVCPWFYNIGATNSPFKDVKVRQALNYCIDRDGLVSLLNGTAEPSVGWLKSSDPDFGSPANRYKYDAAKGKALLAEAGYTAAKPLSFKAMISNSGSGQMLPLPMNEFLQQNLKEACAVNVEFNVTEWQVLLTAARATPDAPNLQGAMVLNISCLPPMPASWRAISRQPIFRRTVSTSSNGRTMSLTTR